MLRPHRVEGAAKIRVGSRNDGGYVMIDDLKGVRTAFSLGVGDNVDWDHAIAERGITVHQFDHTVDETPQQHPGFRFHQRRIAAAKAPNTDTIETILAYADDPRPASSILKIDIENDEWEVFAATSAEALGAFSQIVCEFHGFEHLHKEWHFKTALAALEKLKAVFEVVHVHGNNVGQIVAINGAPLPIVMEVTLGNRGRFDTRPSREVFPTSLDAPNDATKPDYDLGRFEF